MKKLLCLCLATFTMSVAGAETAVKTTGGGHWVPYQDVGLDRNRNGRIDRTEWSRPLPSKKDRPWAQPQPLQGQTRRWDLKWVESSSPALPTAQTTKI